MAATDNAQRLELFTSVGNGGICRSFTYVGPFGDSVSSSSQIAAITLSNKPEFFVHNTSNTIGVLYWSGTAWTWNAGSAPPGVNLSDINLAATSWASDGISYAHVWAIGSDGNVWLGSFRPGIGWAAWVNMGAPFPLLLSDTKSLVAGHYSLGGANDYEFFTITSTTNTALFSRLYDPNARRFTNWTSTLTAPATLGALDAFAADDGQRQYFTTGGFGATNDLIRYSTLTSVWDFQGWYWDSFQPYLWSQSVVGGLAEFSMAESTTHSSSSALGTAFSASEFHTQYASSLDDGASWGHSQQVPEYYVNTGKVTLNGDPIVDYDSNGTAFVTSLNGVVDSCTAQACGAGAPYKTAIYYVSTADAGATFSAPVLVAEQAAGCVQSNILDHPGMAINRTGNIKHFVWCRLNSTSVSYRNQNGLGVFDPPVANSPYSLTQDANCNNFGRPKIVVGSDGTPYAAYARTSTSAIQVCRITGNSCSAQFDAPAGTWDTYEVLTGNPTMLLDAGDGYQLVPSNSDPTKLYLVTHVFDYSTSCTDVDPAFATVPKRDVWIQVLTYNPIGNTLTGAAPVRVDDNPNNDCTDQFLPTAVSTVDGKIYVGWYDRRNTVNGKANYYITPYYAVSSDGGLTFSANAPLGGPSPPSATDPSKLPKNCANSADFFLGDYNSSRGDAFHEHMIFGARPYLGGTVPADASQWTFGSGFYGF